MATVLVLGGGTGGVIAARKLRRLLNDRDRVVLVDRTHRYGFAPSFLWVMTGARRPARITADLRTLRRKGIEFVEADVVEVDTARRSVKTSEAEIAYDRLVVALGADLAPETLPGFPEAARSPYSIEGAVDARAALERFRGGRLAVLISALPYKCPSAPYEMALLADAFLRRRRMRSRTEIAVYSPEPSPLPMAGYAVGRAVADLLEVRGIDIHLGRTAERIDPAQRAIAFTDGETEAFDLLLGVPPHTAPEVLRRSGLAGENGYVPVDRLTLETSEPGVFAIGDVTSIALAGGGFLPKAGVFAESEGGVVAKRIAADLAGRGPEASFDGWGACLLETGDGLAACASGDFYAEPEPEVRLRHPARRWHLMRLGLETYWMRRWL